jgi:hypothetical protein
MAWYRLAAGAVALVMTVPASVAAQPAAGAEFQVNVHTTSYQEWAAVASDADGDFVVVWSSDNQEGGFSVGVFGRRYSSAGVAQGGDFQVNTYTTNDQTFAAVDMDADGDFVVAWGSDGQDGSDDAVIGRRYNSAGVAQGGEFQVNTYTTAFQGSPAVATDTNGNFVVVWTSQFQDGSAGVFGRLYNSAGAAQSGEFQVNTYTSGDQQAPAVDMDADGDFVVVWQSGSIGVSQDGSRTGVFGRRFNSAGVAQGSEFQANTYTTDYQWVPAVAMDADGDFVVMWSSTPVFNTGQDGSSVGVFARRYSSAGVAQGGEFQVNTYTTGAQGGYALATDSDGDFVVAWSSYGQDGSYGGIFAQRYDSAGVAQGGEFQVNTYTTDYQRYPAMAMDAGGDFVVVWQSYGQDGSYDGIFGQRFATPAPPGVPVLTSQGWLLFAALMSLAMLWSHRRRSWLRAGG